MENPTHSPSRKLHRWLLLGSLLAILGPLGCQRFAQETPTPIPSEEAFSPESAPQTPPAGSASQASPLSVDRIAYVGSDFQIYTVNPDGTDRQVVSATVHFPGRNTSDPGPDVIYGWPSWSPDGARLMFSGFIPDPAQPAAALFTTDARGRGVTELFASPVGALNMVADDSPHYALWSPDGRHVAFLAGDQGDLSLYVAPGSGATEAQLIAAGAPLYMAWSHDSQSLLVHRRGDLLRVDPTVPSESIGIGSPSPVYRAPAGSPTEDMMAYLVGDEAGMGTLYTGRLNGSQPKPMAPTSGFASFLWAPQGDRIAIGQFFDPTDPYLRDIRVVDVATNATLTLVEREELVLAFFWSPDGSRIALVTATPSGDALQWQIVDSRTGASLRAVPFVPSSYLLTLLTYFDQYSYSQQVWSPDSRFLVFAGGLPDSGGGPRAGQRTSQVFIVDVEANTPPVPIAEGHLASWSS